MSRIAYSTGVVMGSWGKLQNKITLARVGVYVILWIGNNAVIISG